MNEYMHERVLGWMNGCIQGGHSVVTPRYRNRATLGPHPVRPTGVISGQTRP